MGVLAAPCDKLLSLNHFPVVHIQHPITSSRAILIAVISQNSLLLSRMEFVTYMKLVAVPTENTVESIINGR